MILLCELIALLRFLHSNVSVGKDLDDGSGDGFDKKRAARDLYRA